MTAAVGGFLLGSPAAESQRARPRRAPIPEDTPPRPENETACNYQEPIPWLIRENFLARARHSREEQRARRRLQAKAVRFRTEHYGYYEGFGRASWNRRRPLDNATRVEFMGRRTRLNEAIAPVLSCVEEQLRAECGTDYMPRRLSGIRDRNTYHNGQISNHVYGIAIDIDPNENTCCRCVGRWQEHELCQSDAESIYDRMAMPPCWVHVFERFGFYWLGRDDMQDTMHFEFLGDPDHILKTAGMPPHMSETDEAPAAASSMAADMSTAMEASMNASMNASAMN